MRYRRRRVILRRYSLPHPPSLRAPSAVDGISGYSRTGQKQRADCQVLGNQRPVDAIAGR